MRINDIVSAPVEVAGKLAVLRGQFNDSAVVVVAEWHHQTPPPKMAVDGDHWVPTKELRVTETP